jgi:hypothetical protein
LIVQVCRRMYAFQESEPDSRPPPVSFSPPKAPPISAPLVPMFTLAMPQSLPAAERKRSARAQVVGEDRRREALRHAVLQRDRLVERSPPRRRRGSARRSPRWTIGKVACGGGDRGLDEVSGALEAGCRPTEDLAAFAFGGLDREKRRRRRLVDERAHQRLRISSGSPIGTVLIRRRASL